MTEHARFDDMAAAHVLGALEPADRSAFEDHLRSCERCRTDVLDLAPIPALLSRLDIEEVDAIAAAAPDAEAAIAAVRRGITGMSRSRRRWRALAAVAAVTTVVAAGAVLADDPPSRTFDGVPLEVAASSAGADASVLAGERTWGTYVWISARDLPPRDTYVLWVIDEQGGWDRAGTFAPTPEGAADLGGSTRHSLDEIDRIVITSEDRSDEILSAS